jgi:methylenetetrahydrofolate dehydrogenase (NADP+)/methenyltetrahydrofolate cyclohydrolase
MDTLLLVGKPVAEAVYERLEFQITALKQEHDIIPGLAVILVGEDPASQVYVNSKRRTFEKMGLVAETIHLPESSNENDVIGHIDRLNADSRYHGILVQLPLPAPINSVRILERISPRKDVDGLHPENLGRLFSGQPRFIPCTPHGILEILAHYRIETEGRHAVVLGRSNLVGKPIAALLGAKSAKGNATVTQCHTGTPDLGYHTRQADLLIVASGKPRLISADMVKEGVDIIDVGVNRVADDSEKGYHLEGDVDTDSMMGKAHAITPVRGGVGVMTVAMLVKNTVHAAQMSAGTELN